MIALYIILGIALIIGIILMINVRFYATYEDTLRVIAKFLFWEFILLPESEKEEKKKKKRKNRKKAKKKDENEKKEYVKKVSKTKGIEGLASILIELVKLICSAIKGLAEHAVVKKFEFLVKVAGEDAADTALKYGKYCGVIYSAVSLICGTAKCDDYTLKVAPDFSDNAKTQIDLDVRFNIRVFYIIKYLLRLEVKLFVTGYKR